MIKLKYKVKTKQLLNNTLFIIIMLFLFPNDYKNWIPFIGIFLDVIPALFVFYFIVFKDKYFISYCYRYWFLIAPFFIALVSSIINNNSVEISFYNLYKIVVIILLSTYFFKSGNIRYFNYLEKISFVILISNFIFITLFDAYLTYSVSGGRIYLISEGELGSLITINFVLFLISNNNYLKKVHYFIYFYMIFMVQFSTTYIIIFAVTFILSNILKINSLKKVIKNYKIIILLILIFFLFMLTTNGRILVSNLFNKSIDYSGRVVIWDSIITIIKNNPLIGIGDLTSDALVAITNVNGATHAHNQILRILLASGFIGLLCYVILIIKLSKIKYYLNKKKLYRIYLCYLIALLIGGLTANTFNNIFYVLTVIVLENLRYEEKCKNNILNYNQKYEVID